jgi:hypothetical protein
MKHRWQKIAAAVIVLAAGLLALATTHVVCLKLRFLIR